MELVLHRLCYIWLHRDVIRCKLWQQYDAGGHWYPDAGGSQEDLSTQRPASASSPTSTAASTRWLDWKPKFETFSTGDLWIHVAELPSEFLRSPLQVSIGRKQVSIKKSSQLIFQVSHIYGKDVLYIFANQTSHVDDSLFFCSTPDSSGPWHWLNCCRCNFPVKRQKHNHNNS